MSSCVRAVVHRDGPERVDRRQLAGGEGHLVGVLAAVERDAVDVVRVNG